MDRLDNPRMEFDIHEVKTHLSKVLARVRAGEEVVIATAGAPIARIVPIRMRGRRQPGTEKGTCWIADDFDAPLPDEVPGQFEGKP